MNSKCNESSSSNHMIKLLATFRYHSQLYPSVRLYAGFLQFPALSHGILHQCFPARSLFSLLSIHSCPKRAPPTHHVSPGSGQNIERQNIESQNIDVAKYRMQNIDEAKFECVKYLIAKYRKSKISNRKISNRKISNAQIIERQNIAPSQD